MIVQLKKSEIVNSFSLKLASLGVSKNTIKNYHSDIGIFFQWFFLKLKEIGIENESFDEGIPFLSSFYGSEFKIFLSEKNHSDSTVNRRLSSLRTFSKFLLQSQIIEADFMEGVINIGSEDSSKFESHPTLSLFQKHLETQKVSKNTIKNYVSDIKHFLSWLETNHQSPITNH